MALTRGFRTTLLKRVQGDADFRRAMLKEGIDTMLAGDVETGKAMTKDILLKVPADQHIKRFGRIVLKRIRT